MPTLTAPTGTDHPSPGIGLFALGVLAGSGAGWRAWTGGWWAAAGG